MLIAAGPLLGFASSLPFTDTSAGYEVSVLVNLLLALLVWPVAIASWKGRVSRA